MESRSERFASRRATGDAATTGAAPLSENRLIVCVSFAACQTPAASLSRRASLRSPPSTVAGDAAAAQHERAVADFDDLLGIRRDQQDRAARIGQFGPDALDLGARADIDAARRVDQQQDADAGGQPARHLHLLLVAAAQRTDGDVDIAGLDLEAVEQVASPCAAPQGLVDEAVAAEFAADRRG